MEAVDLFTSGDFFSIQNTILLISSSAYFGILFYSIFRLFYLNLFEPQGCEPKSAQERNHQNHHTITNRPCSSFPEPSNPSIPSLDLLYVLDQSTQLRG